MQLIKFNKTEEKKLNSIKLILQPVFQMIDQVTVPKLPFKIQKEKSIMSSKLILCSLKSSKNKYRTQSNMCDGAFLRK